MYLYTQYNEKIAALIHNSFADRPSNSYLVPVGCLTKPTKRAHLSSIGHFQAQALVAFDLSDCVFLGGESKISAGMTNIPP